MTRFLHWRKMTWALVLLSVATVAWLVVGGTGTAVILATWLLVAAGLGPLWFMTQPLVRQGRGLQGGFFVRPGPGNWRVLNLHRVHVKGH